jgi:hypothetical protein
MATSSSMVCLQKLPLKLRRKVPLDFETEGIFFQAKAIIRKEKLSLEKRFLLTQFQRLAATKRFQLMRSTVNRLEAVGPSEIIRWSLLATISLARMITSQLIVAVRLFLSSITA